MWRKRVSKAQLKNSQETIYRLKVFIESISKIFTCLTGRKSCQSNEKIQKVWLLALVVLIFMVSFLLMRNRFFALYFGI